MHKDTWFRGLSGTRLSPLSHSVPIPFSARHEINNKNYNKQKSDLASIDIPMSFLYVRGPISMRHTITAVG